MYTYRRRTFAGKRLTGIDRAQAIVSSKRRQTPESTPHRQNVQVRAIRQNRSLLHSR